MRRILIVDDQPPGFSGEISADVRDEDGNSPHLEHINPSDFLADGASPRLAVEKMLGHVGEVALQFWDVVAIDLFLGDFGLSPKEDLEIPLQIAETIRHQNQSTSMILYSGTLANYLEQCFGKGSTDTQLRRVFQASIANFVPRGRVAREVALAAQNPSWLLQIDRLLVKNATIVVNPKEAQFSGQTFADLATLVRKQDAGGLEITRLIAEYGISSFTDLNS